jgi:8-oxo-dGTP pyrophosphatase MutT (NUDIX family)
VVDPKIIAWLEQRLKQDLPGDAAHERMMARVKGMPGQVPEDARASAVLCLLFPIGDELHLLLIRRTEDGRAHSGQISFPGGRKEDTDTDLRATALREAQEETGIMSGDTDIVGQLSPLYIPVSNFLVYPYVAFSAKQPQYFLSRQEVAHVIEMPLKALLQEARKAVVEVTSPIDKTFVRNVNAYRLEDGSVIWGATAMILSELEMILSEYPES